MLNNVFIRMLHKRTIWLSSSMHQSYTVLSRDFHNQQQLSDKVNINNATPGKIKTFIAQSSSGKNISRMPRDVNKPDFEGQPLDFSVSNVSANIEETKVKRKTAMDVAIKLREKRSFQKLQPEDEKCDNPVKRAIAALSMPDLNQLSAEDLAKLLRKHLVYADKKLVIFNKPYGIAMHGGDGVSQSIKNVLPLLSKMVYGVTTNIPLTLCHRLDAYTTGVSVCCADKEMTSYVQKMFREHKVLRKYWAVAVDAPDPMHGIIDIALDRAVLSKKGDSGDYARVIVKPDVRLDGLTGEEIKIKAKGHRAITHYRTLDSSRTLALLELQPQTGVKHQLRVHLADGINCPILGDHKYSHYGKLAPQILPMKVLKRFGIPQSKARYMPMHLHLQSIIIPGVFPGCEKANLMIGARMPFHMGRTLRMFGLSPGVPTEWKTMHSITSTQQAKPRNVESELYFDPTCKTDDDECRTRFSDNNCVKVFRKNSVKVKYKYH